MTSPSTPGLSIPNAVLFERIAMQPYFGPQGSEASIPLAVLNRLLDAARAEGAAMPPWLKPVPIVPTGAMVDAARGLCMFFNGIGGERWTLGQHAESGGYGEGYAHLLTDEERAATHFPKAHQADLIYRAMLSAAPPIGEGGER